MNIQQLRAQIASLQNATMDENRNFRSDYDKGKFDALSAVDALLDTLREEPVSEDLEEAIEQSFIYHENRGDDCRMDEQMETTYRLGFETGANWRKEQMMAKAKGGTVQKDYQIILDDGTYIDLDPSMSLKPSLAVKEGERVKVIVIKED